MALDLGTLYVNIKANTADTQRNIDNVKTSLQGIKNETANTTDVMNKSFDNMGGDINKATGAVANLMGSVKGGISGVLSGIGSIASSIPVVGAAAAAAVGAVSTVISEYKEKFETYDKYVNDSAAYIDDINTKASVSGLSTEVIMFFDAVSALTDVSTGDIESAMYKLKNAIVGASEGDEGLADAFKELGVSLTGEDGSERPLEDIFNDVIGAMQDLPAGSVSKMALANTLFGKSAQNLNPILNTSAEEWGKLKTQYEEAYDYISKHDWATLQDLQDAKDLGAMYEDAYGKEVAALFAEQELIKQNAENEKSRLFAKKMLGDEWTNDDILALDAALTTIAETENKIEQMKKDYAKIEKDTENALEVVEEVKTLNDENATFWQKTGAWFGKEWDYLFHNSGYHDAEIMMGEARAAEAWQETLDNMGVNLVADKVSNTQNKNALDFANDPLAFAAAKHGINYSEGFAEGVESEEGLAAVGDSVEHLAATAEETLKVKTDSHSPSKLAAKYGLYWSQGFAQGILSGSDAVKAAASFVVNSSASGTNQTVNVVQNNNYNGSQNSFAAQYFSSKRLGSAIAATIRG